MVIHAEEKPGTERAVHDVLKKGYAEKSPRNLAVVRKRVAGSFKCVCRGEDDRDVLQGDRKYREGVERRAERLEKADGAPRGGLYAESESENHAKDKDAQRVREKREIDETQHQWEKADVKKVEIKNVY